MIGYGSSKDPLMCDFKDKMEHVASFPEDALCDAQSEAARRMAYTTLNAFLLRKEDPNKLAGIHASLVFVQYMVSHPWTAHLVPIDFPWTAFADFLNNLLTEYDTSDGVIDDEVFPISRRDDPRPCLEDYALRGLLWADICFPEGWFPDELEDHPQIPSTSLMAADRKRRILWLAVRIARKLPSRLLYEAASFNPILTEINKPQFSAPRSLYSSHQVLETTELSEISSHASEMSKPISMKLLGSLASRSRDDDSDLNGMRATLGLPIDTLEQKTEYMSAVQTSSAPAARQLTARTTMKLSILGSLILST